MILLSNNERRQIINLIGQGESYTRNTISPGHDCLSSFSPVKNYRQIFLSKECIILKSMLTCSNRKFMIGLHNNSDEEIMFQWKEYNSFYKF